MSLPDIGFGSKTNHDQLGGATYPRYMVMYAERKETSDSIPNDEDPAFGFRGATTHTTGTDAKVYMGILNGVLPTPEHNITVSNLSAGIVIETDRITVKPGIILDPIAQGSAPAVAGSLIYNTSTGELNYHDSGGWNIVSAGGLSSHVLDGAYHTATGLTVGWVISADSATTFSWKAPSVTDDNAIHDNVANEITAIVPKTTLVAADEFILEDSEASGVKKAVTFGNIEASASLANLGTRTHVSLSDAPTNAHHSETHTLAVTGPHTGTLPLIDLAVGTRGSIIRRGAADWEEFGMGSTDYVLKVGALDVEWGLVNYDELGGTQPAPVAHNLIDTTGHPVSSLTPGHFIKADSATTYSFQAHGLSAGDVGAYTTAETDSAIDTDISTHAGIPAAHHVVYLDSDAVAAVVAEDPLTLTNDLTVGGGNLGIARAATTVGTITPALEIYNRGAGVLGPIVHWYSSDDSTHPRAQMYPEQAGVIALAFDAYFNGSSWISSDAGSSFQIFKLDDKLQIRYDTAAVGTNITWDDGIILDASGNVTIGNTLAATINAGIADYNKFLVSDSGLIKFRTGTEVASDIGAATVPLALTDLASYVQGSIIIGGGADWEALGSGTEDYVLKMGAAEPAWGQVDWSELSGSQPAPVAHNLIDTTGHPVSSLNDGHFLKATGTTTYAFEAHGLGASDVGASPAFTKTQWTLPVFDTTTTLGDSMITQNSAGTAAVVNGDLTVSSLTFTSAVFGTYIPYKVANTGIAPITMSQFQSLRRGVLQTLHPLTGEKDHFYLIDKQSAWTIGSTGGTPSGENNIFNNQLDSNCLITVADLPYVLTITHSGTITATDVLYLEILGHRLSSGAFTLKEWKVEVRETAGSVWWTVLDRSAVTDPPNIAVPLWIIGMDGVDYKYIDGIRLTITSADGSSWAPLEIYLAKLALINTRPSGTPAQAIGALDIVGGTVYGNVTIIGGDLTAANIITAGNVDGVDVSDFKTAYDAHDGGDVETYHTNYYTDTDVEGIITAEIVDGQSIDNAIDSLISTHDVAGAHILWEDSAAGTIHTDNYLEYTDAAVESVITAELVDGQSIDLAIDSLISDHAGDDDAHHALVTVGGVPLTLVGQAVTFNYDANYFRVTGNDLQIGIDAPNTDEIISWSGTQAVWIDHVVDYTTSDFTTDFAAESLANLTTRTHANLSDAPADAHHVAFVLADFTTAFAAESLANLTTRAHSDLSDAPTSAHHVRYADSEAIDAVVAENPLTLTYDLTITGGNLGIGIAADASYLIESIDGNYLSRLGRTQIGHATYTNYAAFCYRGMSGAGQYALLQNSLGSTYLNAATGQTVYFGVNHVTEMNLTSSGLQMQAAGARVDEFSTDVDLAGNSDVALVTEKAIKTYVDAATGGPGSGTPWDLPVWDTTTTLGDSMISQNSGGTLATVDGALTVSGALKAGGDGFDVDASGNITDVTIAAATVDTDKFVVQDGSQLKYRTGAQVLSDIGAGGTQKVGPSCPPFLQNGARWTTFATTPVIEMLASDNDCLMRTTFRVPDEWPTGACDIKIMYSMSATGAYSVAVSVGATSEGDNWIASGKNVLDESTAHDFPTGNTNTVYIKTIALSDADITPGCTLGLKVLSDALNTPALYIMEMWIEP